MAKPAKNKSRTKPVPPVPAHTNPAKYPQFAQQSFRPTSPLHPSPLMHF